MEEKLAAAGKDVLVEIVKLTQKQGMRGEKGGWKDFLQFHDKQLGASLSDPARRSADVLLDFLKTFKEESDLKVFAKVMNCQSNREVAKQLLGSKNSESPEQKLVRLTFEHPQYPIEYSFPSHEEDWVISKISKKIKEGKSDKLLAVDCEMVLCEDGSEALVKICVVDRNLKVKLHEFVNPGKVVVDYRTSVTGITEEDLRGATTSLSDIQKSMKKLLSHGTILVGHSLSNDLKALKIDHPRVVDTSFIFKYGDESTKRRPSLNDLCKSVLGHEVRKKGAAHNCQDDACAAMKLVLAKMEHGFDDVLPIIEDNGPDGEMTKLLLHRIPISMPSEDVNQIIGGEFTIEVQKNKKGKGERYSALAIFRTPKEALQAFDNVEGDEVEDSFGHPQKSISIKLGSGETDTIYIRKMTRGNHAAQVSTKKRPCPTEETSSEHKILKTDQTTDVSNRTSSADLVEEVDRLRRLLRERDDEISSLHKIIVALTRKQFL